MNTLTQILTPLLISLGLVQPVPIVPDFTPIAVEPIVIEQVVEPVVEPEVIIKEVIVEKIIEKVVEKPVYVNPVIEEPVVEPIVIDTDKQDRFDDKFKDDIGDKEDELFTVNTTYLPAKQLSTYIMEKENGKCLDALERLEYKPTTNGRFYDAIEQYDYYISECNGEDDDYILEKLEKILDERSERVEGLNNKIRKLADEWNVEYEHLLLK